MVQKFGVSPESIPDYLALVGDAADGYPGLSGLGREIFGCGAGQIRSSRLMSRVLLYIVRNKTVGVEGWNSYVAAHQILNDF